MTTPAYVNCRASDLIAAQPHAVYRVTLEREGLSQLSFAIGILKWRDVVLTVIERSPSPAGFPISGGLDSVTNDDDRAVLDFLAGSQPGAATVGDLARTIDVTSSYAAVIRVERLPGVPKESQGGADALRTSQTERADAEREQAAKESFTGRVTDLASGLAGNVKMLAVVAVVTLVIAAVVIYGPPRPRTPANG